MAGTALGNEGPSSGLGLADDPVDATGGQASPGFAGLKRLQNVISRGFVHGTIAFSLGKKGDDSASHKWSCYVRGPDDFEISPFIKQVAFHLHPSFNNPTRVFKSPPYEVHEQGWGEFDIVIKIHFTPDAGLRPLEIHHALKLYPNAEQSQVVHPRARSLSLHAQDYCLGSSCTFANVLLYLPAWLNFRSAVYKIDQRLQ